MPAKPIKHVNKGNVVFLQDANYEAIYVNICRTLGKDAPFASIELRANEIIWTQGKSGKYRSIIDAPNDLKGTLVMLWEHIQQELRPKLAAQKMDYVLIVPDLSYIFYMENADCDDGVLNHRFRLLITGWACEKNANQHDDGQEELELLKHEADSKHQNVIVVMKNIQGIPLANTDFIYLFNDSHTMEVRSNDMGECQQGICVVGSRLTFVLKSTKQKKNLMVQKNIERYDLVFAPTTKVSIKVVDQYDKPMQMQMLHIEYGDKVFNLETDGLGMASINDLLYLDSALKLTITVEGFFQESFSVQCPDNSYLVKVERPEDLHPYVKVMRGEIPEVNYSVKITGEKFIGTYDSDINGIVRMDALSVDDSFVVESMQEENVEPQRFIILKNESEYIFQLLLTENPTFKEEPILELEEENIIDCYIKVVKGDEMKPVPDFSLQLRIDNDSLKGGYLTNMEGIVPLQNLKVGMKLAAYTSDNNELTEFIIKEGQGEYLIHLPEDKPEAMLCHIKLVKGNDMIPVGNYLLHIESDTMSGNYLTDTYGILLLTDMKPEVKVSVYTSSEVAPVILNIEEGKEEYLIQLPEPSVAPLSDITVTLVDKDRVTPVTGATITLTNNQAKTFTQMNDNTGSIIVPRSFFTNKKKVRFHAGHAAQRINDCRFRFMDDCDHYMIHLKDPFPWKRLLWLLLLLLILLLCFVRCERDITVYTIDNQDRPVPTTRVQLKYVEHQLYKNGQFFYSNSQLLQGVTDVGGEYTFEKMPCSIFSYVFYVLQKGIAMGEKNTRFKGENRFLFHWVRKIDVVLSGNYNIQVRSRKDDNPILEAQVKVDGINNEAMDTTMLTDSKGLCYMSAKEPLQIDNLVATKTGYSGTMLKNVSLDENADPLIVYLDEPEPCHDQGMDNNARNQGEFAIRDFDMGIDNGEFIFNYYTDSAPDNIEIYNGSSSEYMDGKASCIFSFSGATNTTTYKHYGLVKFSSRFICVVVKGGTNWGYVVQCPINKTN